MNKTSLEFISGEDQLFHALKIKDNDTQEDVSFKSRWGLYFYRVDPQYITIYKMFVSLDARGFIQNYRIGSNFR